jgi:hypothetical protein
MPSLETAARSLKVTPIPAAEMVVNRRTATALGLAIPPSILLRLPNSGGKLRYF